MKKHLKCLRYLLLHKYYVFKAGRKIGVGIFQLLKHDWSKFLPSEWFAYADFFYGKHPSINEVHGDMRNVYTGKYKEQVYEDFNVAWLKHQNRNKHHWQYWVLLTDSGNILPLDIPDKYVKEMVADWIGAGMMKNGENEVASWFARNRENMLLSKRTLERVRELIELHG